MPENNRDNQVTEEAVKKTASKEVDRSPAKPEAKAAAVKKHLTLEAAYELLTGNDFSAQNNSNIFGQLDRAFRQSTDEVLKEKVAKDLGFKYNGPRG